MAKNNPIYDIAIVGAGPAGLTAAIYALRDKKRVVIFEEELEGGQMLNTNSIVNIPGFPEISGQEFAQRITDQIELFNTNGEMLDTIYERVVDIKKDAGERESIFTITTNDASRYFAKTVICCTGAVYRRLNVPGEKALIGDGISFCSTCDAPFCKGHTVAVIGGGNSALTEALEISRFAKTVRIIQNLPELTASKDLIDIAGKVDNIEIVTNKTVTGFDKDKGGIVLWTADKEGFVTPTGKYDNIFIAIGMTPNNDYMSHIGTIDEDGYIKDLIDGAFAAGDCKRITANQIVIACGSGAKAAIKACRYLNGGIEI